MLINPSPDITTNPANVPKIPAIVTNICIYNFFKLESRLACVEETANFSLSNFCLVFFQLVSLQYIIFHLVKSRTNYLMHIIVFKFSQPSSKKHIRQLICQLLIFFIFILVGYIHYGIIRFIPFLWI